MLPRPFNLPHWLKLFSMLFMLLSGSVVAREAEIDDWEDDWTDKESSSWRSSGFIESAYGGFLQDNVVNSKQSMSEIRAHFELNYSHSLFEGKAKADLLYDDVLSTTLWQTRELTINTSPLVNLDLKIGRQVLTWGTGDYLFLNDLFPKDWQSFFSGRDDEYLKSPSDSLRLSTYVSGFTFELVWTPQFTPDIFLTGERFSFYSPKKMQIVAPADTFIVHQTSNEQWAARMATNKKGIEYALYAYHGYWTTPLGINPLGQAYFPELKSLGGSIRLPLSGGLFNVEFSYYQSSEDSQGDKLNISNDQFRFLMGYEHELAKNLTLSGQYYLEKTLNYSAFVNSSINLEELVAENRHLLTLRLRYVAMQQKLTYSLFSFYSPSDSDYYLRPTIAYRANDKWSYSLGGNLFSGKHQYSFFGQHEDNSNIWVRLRYQY